MPLSSIIGETTVGKVFNDCRLHGDALTLPLKWCIRAMGQALASWTTAPKPSGWCERGVQVVKKGVPLAALAAVSIPAAAAAAVGTVVKRLDLYRRVDQLAHEGAAITYSFPLPLEIVSRLGDRISNYLHTKYVGDKCGIPVYFCPFAGAEFFQFSGEERLKADSANPKYFKSVVYLKSGAEIEALAQRVDRRASVLYVLPYFPDSRVETEGPYYSKIRYQIDWQAFKPRVKQLLEVVKPYQRVAIPADAFSIALHIRTGGTYDSADTATMLPPKLPPLSYYIGELKNLLSSPHAPKNKPFFVHIFTDDVDPAAVCRKLREGVQKFLGADQVMTFSCNEHPQLIDDVANMARFNCLIRPDSNLSGTLAKTADQLIEIFPTHFKVNRKWTEITIDEVVTVYPSQKEERRITQYTLPVVQEWYRPTLFYRIFHYFIGVDSHSAAKPRMAAAQVVEMPANDKKK